MPRTKKALERKYKNYSGTLAFYQTAKFRSQFVRSYQYARGNNAPGKA